MRSECNLSFETIVLKLEAYCAYQDRCSAEVQQKIAGYNCSFEQEQKIIEHLIAKRFLDDTRFVESYCSGKFKVKRWGKAKIRQGLIQKCISKEQITEGLKTIDPDEYWNTLCYLAERKWGETVSEKDFYKRKAKVFRFLAQRGFEQDLIYAALGAFIQKD